MNEDAKQFLKKCIELYSHSGKEQKLSEFLSDFLRKSDFQVKFDNVSNLIAEKGSGKPLLLLISHLDFIPGKLNIEEIESKLYGREAVYYTSSLAAMVYSLSKYNFNKENTGKILFAGIVKEENSLIGIQEFLKNDIQPYSAIFGEPTKINQICIGHKGRLCIGYRVLSEPGHVANSWQYINTIDVCLEIWKMIKGVCWQLTEMYCAKDPNTKYFNQVIPNLMIISGGQLTDYIPSECEMHVDIRFPPEIKIEILLNEIRKSIINFKEVYQKQFDLKFQVQENISSLIDGFETEKDELIIDALEWAIFNTLNVKPELIKNTGTTFLNAIGIHYGIPTITYGPRDAKLEHINGETIEIDEFLNSLVIYSKFFDRFFDLYQKKLSK